MERILRRNHGLSLIETTFSLFLLGVLFVLLANLFPSSVAAARQNEDRYQAELLAESLLAEHMARDFSSLTLTPPSPLPTVQTESGLEYHPTLEVFQVGARSTDLVRGLRVRIQWQVQEVNRETVHEVWVSNFRR